MSESKYITVQVIDASMNNLIPENERIDKCGFEIDWQWFAVVEQDKDKATILRQPGYWDYALANIDLDLKPIDEAKSVFFRTAEPQFIESLPLAAFEKKYPSLYKEYINKINR